jgi:hypothetical protein
MKFIPVVCIIMVISRDYNLKVFVFLSVDEQLQEVKLFIHVYLDHSIGTDGFTIWPAGFPDLLLWFFLSVK